MERIRGFACFARRCYMVGRRSYRSVLVAVLALLTALAVTVAPVGSQPARAASDIVVTVNASDLGVDPSTMQQIVNQVNAQDASMGISLNQRIQRQWEEYGVASNVLSAWVNFDMTLSVTSTAMTLDIPGSEVQTSIAWWQTAIAILAGTVAFLAFQALCWSAATAFFGPGAPLVGLICVPFGGFMSGIMGTLVGAAFAGTLGTPSFYATLAAASLIGLVGGYLWARFFQGWAEGALATAFTNMGTFCSKLARIFGALFGSGASGPMNSVAQLWGAMSATIPSAIRSAAVPSVTLLPCDEYGTTGTPCAAAYSTVRALFYYYGGPLYQVQRASDNATADIGLLAQGGYVNASEQDSFCAGTTCTITKLYDQSPVWNDLSIQAGDSGAAAAALPITAGGHEAYGVDIEPGTGYRNNNTQSIAVNGQPEGMYMVASGTHVNSGCCFDFGNVETNSQDNGASHMDAVNLTTACLFPPCTGNGPWVQADLENGQYMGNGPNPGNLGNNTPFVTAMLKNDGANFALKGGDATTGVLTTWYNGPLPSGYSPMHQEGGIVLGTGGDNSNRGAGSFFEGVMTQGYPSDGADDYVQSNIVSAGYSGNTGGSPGGGGLEAPAGTITGPGGKCVDVLGVDNGTNGTPIDMWDCDPNAVDQHWTHNADGTLETLGRCLNISVAQGAGGTGTAVPGDHTTLWDCNGSGVEQWVQEPNGTLRNPPSGLCLYGQPSNGWQLQVVACNGSDPNQLFSVNGGNPITNGPSGKCVDVLGDDTGSNGTPVDLWGCLPHAADQHWLYSPYNDQLSTLGRCLSVSVAQGVSGTGTAAPGDHTTLWDCNGSGVEQWVQLGDGTLWNPPSGLCLYGQPSNGWQLQVVGCNGSDPNQQFSVYDAGTHGLTAPAGTITLSNDKCVDVLGADNGTDGSPVDLWDCDPSAMDQHWTHNADGSLETLDRCLSVSVAQGAGGTGTAAPGDHTTLWDCNGSGVEQWVQQPDGTLINPPSGLCLVDPGGSSTNGWQLQVDHCAAGDLTEQFAVNGGSTITDTGSGKCIDVLGDDNGGNGTPVDLWDCAQNAADQHWFYNSVNQSLSTLGKCLSVSVAQGVGGTGTPAAGDHTVLWDCNGSTVEQWLPRPDGTVYNRPSGLCLDDGGATPDGEQLQVQSCVAGDPAQQFGVYDRGTNFVNPVSGKCVDVQGDDNGGDGAPVQLWDCLPEAVDQHWIHTSDGELETLGRCLSVSVAQGVGGTGTASVGNHTTLWDCNGSGVEQWVQQSDGTWLNPPSGLCLDDPNFNTTNGWQLQVWTCNGGTNQIFNLQS